MKLATTALLAIGTSAITLESSNPSLSTAIWDNVTKNGEEIDTITHSVPWSNLSDFIQTAMVEPFDCPFPGPMCPSGHYANVLINMALGHYWTDPRKWKDTKIIQALW